MPQFIPNGCVATSSLIAALVDNNGRWARAVLGQCFSMPKEIQDHLLSGEAEWKTPDEKTLIITLVESP